MFVKTNHNTKTPPYIESYYDENSFNKQTMVVKWVGLYVWKVSPNFFGILILNS